MGKIVLIHVFMMSILFGANGYSAETCSRVAVVNYQDVLVDTSPTKKGEGLRFFLEKDKTAESYLTAYQKGGHHYLYTAPLSSAGTILILAGIFQSGRDSSSSGFSRRDAFFIGGAAMITLSYLVAKTLDYNNEGNLVRAIEEYNKRNLPHIYFNPGTEQNTKDIGVGAGVTKDF